MEVVDLSERGGVVDTCGGCLSSKVAVSLDGILRGAKVGIDGVGTTSGCRVIQFDILARTSQFRGRDFFEVLLHFRQLNIEELLQWNRDIDITVVFNSCKENKQRWKIQRI